MKQKKNLLIVILGITLIMNFASCSTTSKIEESTEPVYESTGFEWYAFLGEWTQGDNYLEFYDDNTFYDSRYNLTGTWDESQDGGDVILIYDGFPDFIYDADEWAEDEKYFECYCLDYDDNALFDPENNDNVWHQ